jgi:hypothetical protein
VTTPVVAAAGDIYRVLCLVDDLLFVLGQKSAVAAVVPAAVVAATAVIGRAVQLV